jgi:sugar fermentation stimulation protein A
VTPAPDDSGVYVYLFDWPEDAQARVGALGTVRLPAGRYAYVGSARRGLAARLARHARKRKPRRWHLDYLATRARPLGALTWPWAQGRECALAAALAEGGAGRVHPPGFGASDCRCPGHLLQLAEVGVARLTQGLARCVGLRPEWLDLTRKRAR